MKWVTASDIKSWADKKQKHCAEILPELIRRLIFATAPSIEQIDFPAGDSIATGGWDGYLKVPNDGKSAFIPDGQSGWEIGAEKSSGKKAEKDYKNRTADSQGLLTSETTYVCVTPRAFPGRIKWQKDKQKEGIWKGVRVLAADGIESWLDLSPAVALWLARQIGNAVQGGTRDLEAVWQEWSLGTAPQMTPELVTAGRHKEVEEVRKWLANRSGMLAVQGDSPDEATAFLYASLANLPEREKVAALSRCVVVESLQEFRAIQDFGCPLIIAAPGECIDAVGAALAKGHQVHISMDATVTSIGSGFIKLSRPQREAVETALKQNGMSALDAQKLSRDFGRSIPALRRNLSISNVVRNPTWATPESASTLVPALLAGSWSEEKEGDLKVHCKHAACGPGVAAAERPLRSGGPALEPA